MIVKAKNVLWDIRDRYDCHLDEIETFEGEVVPTPKWIEYPAICITAPIPSKFRVIAMDRVISMDDKPVKSASPATNSEPRVVKVDGSNGKQYLVTIQGKVKSCNCTGYGFRRTCKHLALAA